MRIWRAVRGEGCGLGSHTPPVFLVVREQDKSEDSGWWRDRGMLKNCQGVLGKLTEWLSFLMLIDRVTLDMVLFDDKLILDWLFVRAPPELCLWNIMCRFRHRVCYRRYRQRIHFKRGTESRARDILLVENMNEGHASFTPLLWLVVGLSNWVQSCCFFLVRLRHAP